MAARVTGCVGLDHAVRALAEARSGPPTETDRPPVSTFPSTRASREARRFDKEKGLTRPRDRAAANAARRGYNRLAA